MAESYGIPAGMKTVSESPRLTGAAAAAPSRMWGRDQMERNRLALIGEDHEPLDPWPRANRRGLIPESKAILSLQKSDALIVAVKRGNCRGAKGGTASEPAPICSDALRRGIAVRIRTMGLDTCGLRWSAGA